MLRKILNFPKRSGYMLVAILLFVTVLIGCTAEHNYRGVPAPFWRELTGEQKQLIVDQAYEQEINLESSSEKNNK